MMLSRCPLSSLRFLSPYVPSIRLTCIQTGQLAGITIEDRQLPIEHGLDCLVSGVRLPLSKPALEFALARWQPVVLPGIKLPHGHFVWPDWRSSPIPALTPPSAEPAAVVLLLQGIHWAVMDDGPGSKRPSQSADSQTPKGVP